jgi:hypothetical protein
MNDSTAERTNPVTGMEAYDCRWPRPVSVNLANHTEFPKTTEHFIHFHREPAIRIQWAGIQHSKGQELIETGTMKIVWLSTTVPRTRFRWTTDIMEFGRVCVFCQCCTCCISINFHLISFTGFGESLVVNHSLNSAEFFLHCHLWPRVCWGTSLFRKSRRRRPLTRGDVYLIDICGT